MIVSFVQSRIESRIESALVISPEYYGDYVSLNFHLKKSLSKWLKEQSSSFGKKKPVAEYKIR